MSSPRKKSLRQTFHGFCGLLLALSLIEACHAGNSFYQVSLIVENHQNQASKDDFRQGLQSLLTKITVLDSFEDNPTLTNALDNAPQYIKAYSYSKQGTHWSLNLSFEPSDISQLLEEANVTPWRDSPATLLTWISLQEGTHQTLINADTESDAAKAMTKAHALGLDLMMPTLDLVELNQLPIKLSLNPTLIQELSKPYRSDIITAIDIEELSPDEWQATWILFYDAKFYRWQEQHSSLSALYQKGFNRIKHYLTQMPNSAHMTVSISHVESQDDYQKLLTYLQKIPGVSQVELDSVTPQSVLYRLDITHSIEQIKSNILRDGQLVFEQLANDTFYYRLTT